MRGLGPGQASAAGSNDPAAPVDAAEAGRDDRRRSHAALLGLMAFWGYASGVNGTVAPFLARSFGLDDAGIARLFAWIGLASAGALLLGRLADRLGRRRLLLFCFAGLPLAAVASAAARDAGEYVVAQLATYALGMTLLSTVAVAIAEHGGTAERARSHGQAGMAFTFAAAGPLVVTAVFADRPGVWRGVWAVAALAVLAWPWMRARLAETPLWARSGPSPRALGALFRPPYRRRALVASAAAVLVSATELAARTWLVYHPVRALGLAPSVVAALLIGAGGLGLVGFPLGGRLADRLGRRLTFAIAAMAGTGCVALFFWGSTHVDAGLLPLLFVAIFGIAITGNAAVVAFRAHVTELFPTRLRGTLGGLQAVSAAGGWLLAMGAVAGLTARLGGVGSAVTVFVVVSLPLAALLVLCLPETAGLDLEVASLEIAAPSERPAPVGLDAPPNPREGSRAWTWTPS